MLDDRVFSRSATFPRPSREGGLNLIVDAIEPGGVFFVLFDLGRYLG
jgi:hypothetical protein